MGARDSFGHWSVPNVSSSIFVLVDDKHVPVFRIMWVSDTPHFCGNEDCTCEGDYEVRLEQDESVWASRQERDNVLKAVEAWYNGEREQEGEWDEEGE
jgi:hypothetical protein